jgi:hypothetical protein
MATRATPVDITYHLHNSHDFRKSKLSDGVTGFLVDSRKFNYGTFTASTNDEKYTVKNSHRAQKSLLGV